MKVVFVIVLIGFKGMSKEIYFGVMLVKFLVILY